MKLPEGVKMTPMLRQYLHWKERYPDCLLFFRMGDFFELFFDDARLAASVLDIALTARDGEKQIPMAGVPHHAAEGYLARLIQAGYKVALCDQVTEPDGRTLVERSVVRVVTPGTYIPEESGHDGGLAAMAIDGDWVFLALLRPATGRFEALTLPVAEARGVVAAFGPLEVLYPSGSRDRCIKALPEVAPSRFQERPREEFDLSAGERWLCRRFGLASLRAHGIDDGERAVGPAAAALRYLEETQFGAALHVHRLRPLLRQAYLHLDVTTQANLELVDSEGPTLFSTLNRCRTALGKRLLRQWILQPLKDLTAIGKRQDEVAAIVADHPFRLRLQDQLSRCRDVERLLGRLSLRMGSPRELGALRDTLLVWPDIVRLCEGMALEERCRRVPPLEALTRRLDECLAVDLPRLLREGGVIRDGYNEELDHWRNLSREGNAGLEALACAERAATGIKSLKVGYNKVFGYYIEVSKAHADRVPEHYVRKQTLVGAERFITDELKHFEEEMAKAGAEMARIEEALFNDLLAAVLAEAGSLQIFAETLARLDLEASLAEVAWEGRWVRPDVGDGLGLRIKKGRHPVVERALAEAPFTPNDIVLDSLGERISILTGPNMAGKSTYLRMAALLVIMAQMGSFLPVEEARVGLVDRIFTRIGARDELARGRSTFMVEMVETADILHNVTDRSLVILDEIGRGTSTYDGMSIAWAVLEYLIQTEKRPKVLFATHFHELTQLADRYAEVANWSMAVEEGGEGITFLHQVVPRSADRSYGIEVARLAGLPQQVIVRAQELLELFEGEEGLTATEGTFPKEQLPLFTVASDAVVDEIAAVDPDGMTPFQALEKLYELRRRCQEVRRSR